MNAIVIDDEPLAVELLEKKLDEIEGIAVIGKYTNPHRGLEAIIKKQPDIVFLDIDMPEINGIELADKVQRTLSDIKIVFITAYPDYAVKAFELKAEDYILKPIQSKRLVETINHISKIDKKKLDSYPMVCCFQNLYFIKHDGENSQVIDVHWRTSKARELFAYLIQHRQKFVRKDVIIEHFWQDANWKDGYGQLYSTIYQIRKTLASIGFNITIISSENSYKLELNDVLLDVDEWENRMEKLSFVNKDTLLQYKKLLNLYKGDFLGEDDYLWAENERSRLRVLWLGYVKKAANYLIDIKKYSDAIILYLQVQKVQPLVEESYFMLMQLYNAFGDRYSVKKQYCGLKKMLQEEYEAMPSEAIQKWYQKWEKS
ncbi:response regulator [Bacillus aquiflavi]|uniref:Response regulator n=1 Tax=Bacillus aquiflavi TaxID=2672567 RepID=A0A6B3W2Q9_9BACI|nr:response regulator [Bacillus aquiflavi]MBA4538665.1 response regulator [Bacillus aquiflavi]NEY83025.1 response regulator [Bacillus aquiflavi]